MIRFFAASRFAISCARSMSFARGTTSFTRSYCSAFYAGMGSHIHIAYVARLTPMSSMTALWIPSPGTRPRSMCGSMMTALSEQIVQESRGGG